MSIFDIISYAEEYLVIGIVVSLLITLIILGYYIFYKKIIKGKKEISFRKLAVATILLCYLIIIIGATLASRGSSYYGNAYTHPFSSYREAWNRFSPMLWRNIILNILMFVPIGFLLPVFSNKFKKAWRTYLAGFLLTLGIELIQHITGRGIFEIDDIIGNTFGTLIGYGLITLLFYLGNKLRNKTSTMEGRKIVVYQIPLIVTLVLFSSIFSTYNKQELGNLAIAHSYKYNMSDIRIESNFPLSELSRNTYVYKAKVGTKDETLQLANNILKNLNTEVDENQNDYSEDTAVYKSVSGEHSIWVNYRGLTIWFNDFTRQEDEFQKGCTLEEVISVLESYDIVLPKDISFEEKEDGNYILTAEMAEYNDSFIDGELYCTITKDGELSSFENKLIQYVKYKEYEVMSEQEALENLKKGKVNHLWLYEKPKSIDVQRVKLDYLMDSKGYYQPIYVFEVFFNGDKEESIEIPMVALKD